MNSNAMVKGATLFLMTIIAMLVSASNINSEEWWILSAGDAEGNAYLIDGVSKLEKDFAVSYNAHFFYKIPVNGVSSAQIEYYINCTDRTLREARYVDFNDLREPIHSGDNYELNSFYQPAAGTIGDELLIFSCANESERQQRYDRVGIEVDKWSLGEYLLSKSTARPRTR